MPEFEAVTEISFSVTIDAFSSLTPKSVKSKFTATSLVFAGKLVLPLFILPIINDIEEDSVPHAVPLIIMVQKLKLFVESKNIKAYTV